MCSRLLLRGLVIVSLVAPAMATEPASQPVRWQPNRATQPASGAGRWHFRQLPAIWRVHPASGKALPVASVKSFGVPIPWPDVKAGWQGAGVPQGDLDAAIMADALAPLSPDRLFAFECDNPNYQLFVRGSDGRFTMQGKMETHGCWPIAHVGLLWLCGSAGLWSINYDSGQRSTAGGRLAVCQSPDGRVWCHMGDGRQPTLGAFHGPGAQLSDALDAFAFPVGSARLARAPLGDVYHWLDGEWKPMGNPADPHPGQGTASMVCGRRMLMTTRTAVWEFDGAKTRWVSLAPPTFRAFFDAKGRRVLADGCFLAVLDGDPFETGKQLLADDDKLWADLVARLDDKDFAVREKAAREVKDAYGRLVVHIALADDMPDFPPEAKLRLDIAMKEITPLREAGDVKIANLLSRMHPDLDRSKVTTRPDGL